MTDTHPQEMQVKKRNGIFEDVSFDKILNRVKKLGTNIKPILSINYTELIMKVIDQLHSNISTSVIDELTAEQCASLNTKHPDYGVLASRIIISNNHKNTLESFYETMHKLYSFTDIHDKHIPLVHNDFWNSIEKHKNYFNSIIDYERDFEIQNV